MSDLPAKAACSVSGCEREYRANGYCGLHERRWKIHGDPLVSLGTGKRRWPLPEVRFWSKVERSPGCWEWRGTKNPHGYGIFENNRKRVQAHRFSWEIANGRPIPEGLVILHACDNPPCVNPAHLSVGTHADNVADSKAKRRHTFGRKQHDAKLTEELVREIRGASGTNYELAARYGVSYQTISRVRRRELWKHVP